MNLLKSLPCGLAAGVAVATLLMPVEKAEATVIGYSSLQVTSFSVISGGAIIDIPSAIVVNTTSSTASLGGVNDSSAAPANGAPGSALVADSDVPLSCVGTCGGIAQNDYSSVAVANPGTHFARGDARLTGSILVPGGGNGRTVAESQLISGTTSSGNAAIQSIGSVSTIEFTIGQGGAISLTFDVLGELRAFSDEAGGAALVDFDFGLQLFDITNGGGLVGVGISSVDGATDFSSLNQARSAIGIEEFNYLVDDTFTLTVTGLLSDTTYRLQITQNSDVSASTPLRTSVPEPGALTLLSVGLLGVGVFAARRRGSSGSRPSAG